MAAAAPLLLLVSIAARLAWTYLVPNGANFVDLHVYVGGAGTLGERGTLYDYVYADQTPDFPLPFTYPPFAAVVFYPLHLLPFGLVALAWQLGIVVALYGVVRISQRLLPVDDEFATSRRVAMLWTAVGIWLEPLRSTFDYGQINVLLVLAVLYAVYSTRWWVSGLLVGLAAGVKLTPAVSGLYFLGVRRWGTVVFSAVVFFATIGVSALVVGDQTSYYFTELLGDAGRVGPIGTSFNQSWRGGISRILGHDAGYGPLVVAAIVVTAALALLAWRAVGTNDRLGGIVVVQLFGLLLSPISWTHHWVWVLPLMIWLLHGPLRQRLGARILGLGLAGADTRRCAVAAELRPAHHLGDQQALVLGVGRADLHRGDVGDAGVDRRYRSTIWFISRAIARSFWVIPPAEWVTSAKVTVRQRISMSG